jgi:hypothetical protein
MTYDYNGEVADVTVKGLVNGRTINGVFRGMSVEFFHWENDRWDREPCESSGPYPGLRTKSNGIDFAEENILGAKVWPCRFQEGDTYTMTIHDRTEAEASYHQWLGGLSMDIFDTNNMTPLTPGLATFTAGPNNTLSPNTFALRYRPTLMGRLVPAPANYENVEISARGLWTPANDANYPNLPIDYEGTPSVKPDSSGNFAIPSHLRPGYQYTLWAATRNGEDISDASIVILGNFTVPLTDYETYGEWMDAIRAHPRLQTFVAPDGDGLIDDLEFAVPAGFGGGGSGTNDPAPPNYEPIIVGADGEYATVGATVSVSPPPATDGWVASYRWERDGQAIASATANAYTLTASDAGHQVTCRVTLRRPGAGDVERTSPAINVRSPVQSTGAPPALDESRQPPAGEAAQPPAGEAAPPPTGEPAPPPSSGAVDPAGVTGIRTAFLKLIVAVKQPVTIPVAVDGAAGAKLTWKSSNTKVARVSRTGKVTPLKTGKVTITATASNRKKLAIKISVVAKAVKVESVKVKSFPKTMKRGKSMVIKPVVKPARTTGVALAFTSSNPRSPASTRPGRLPPPPMVRPLSRSGQERLRPPASSSSDSRQGRLHPVCWPVGQCGVVGCAGRADRRGRRRTILRPADGH